MNTAHEIRLSSVPTHRQKLGLLPFQKTSLAVLSWSSDELGKHLRTVLDTNPFLEEVATDTGRDGHFEAEVFSDCVRTTDAYLDGGQEISDSPDLRRYLLDQLWLAPLNIPVIKAAQVIIDYLDDKGRLDTSLEEIARICRIDRGLLEEGLKAVQALNPSGVGARDMRECLLIQLERLGNGLGNQIDDARLAARCIRDHLDLVLSKKFAQIAERVGASEAVVRESLRILARLDLRPGLLVGPKSTSGVRPDLTVRLKGAKYDVVPSLNPIQVRVISSDWRSARTQLKEARDLVRALRDRNRTLLRIGRLIAREQEEFFELGMESLKPLKMSAVAQRLGLHVSTVSRAIRLKTIETPWGIFPLKMFIQRKCGEGEASQASALQMLRRIIEGEDKARPLSDYELSLRLTGENVRMARRTIAKYRNILNIPAKHIRKELS